MGMLCGSKRLLELFACGVLKGSRMYKLLIVEDDIGIAGGIREQAEKWGLEVRCVEDFNDVLGEFRRFSPHIILMDIMLPFFDGYHWCSEIRRVSKVPIIFISSASDNMNIVMAMNMGGDDFINKPFDLRVLMAKIKRFAAPFICFFRRRRFFGA